MNLPSEYKCYYFDQLSAKMPRASLATRLQRTVLFCNSQSDPGPPIIGTFNYIVLIIQYCTEVAESTMDKRASRRVGTGILRVIHASTNHLGYYFQEKYDMVYKLEYLCERGGAGNALFRRSHQVVIPIHLLKV